MKENRNIVKKLFSFTWKFAIVLLLAGLIAFLVLFLPVMNVKLDTSKLETGHETVSVFDGSGRQMDTTSLNLVKYVNIDEINPHTFNAFVAIEDKRFFKHHGVDTVRIGSAILENIKSGSYKEGASTITQQLVKNLYLSNEKNIQRKTKEIALAVQLEKEYSKMQILEMYLNTIYFGNNAYGIGQAAKCYFNKSANELTLAESATLAAIIKSPASYAPDKDLEKNTGRRNLILSFMFEQEMINIEQYEAAKNETVTLDKNNIHSAGIKGYEHAAISETAKLLDISVPQVKNSGLKIYTYYDTQKQFVLDKAFETDNSKTVSQKDAYKMGIIADNSSGGITAYYGNSLYSLNFQERQIGSTAKPLAVYAPAFEQNIISPASPILDEETSFDGYTPYNANSSYAGWTTVRESLKNSRNTPAVKIFNSLNKQQTARTLNSLGLIEQNEELTLPMALGAFNSGIGIERLTAGYMCLANGGIHKQIGFVKTITNSDGRVLYTHHTKGQRVFRSDAAFLTTDILKDVTKTGTAKSLAELNLPVAGKTGTVGQRGKNNSDTIFAAYTPLDTITVWIFSEYEDLLQSGINGSTAPVAIAKNALRSMYPAGMNDFAPPSSVRQVSIDRVLLEQQHKIELAQDITPSSEQSLEYFSLNNMPMIVSNRIQIVEQPTEPEPFEQELPYWYKPQPPQQPERKKPKTFWDRFLDFF